MQLKNWPAFALYLGCYVPLSLVLLAQDLDVKLAGTYLGR